MKKDNKVVNATTVSWDLFMGQSRFYTYFIVERSHKKIKFCLTKDYSMPNLMNGSWYPAIIVPSISINEFYGLSKWLSNKERSKLLWDNANYSCEGERHFNIDYVLLKSPLNSNRKTKITDEVFCVRPQKVLFLSNSPIKATGLDINIKIIGNIKIKTWYGFQDILIGVRSNEDKWLSINNIYDFKQQFMNNFKKDYYDFSLSYFGDEEIYSFLFCDVQKANQILTKSISIDSSNLFFQMWNAWHKHLEENYLENDLPNYTDLYDEIVKNFEKEKKEFDGG